jgi:malate dehydrogenase (oxaloacetate-decarboxylating)
MAYPGGRTPALPDSPSSANLAPAMARTSHFFEIIRGPDGLERLRVGIDGVSLLRHPLTNRGTGFTDAERVALGLDGLLPPAVTTLEWQIERSYAAFRHEPTALAKYSFLRGLQERNEVLFYALLEQHLAEMLPIIYTPTVGDAVMNASRIYRWPRGVSLSAQNIDRAEQVFNNCMLDDVRIVVATDSSAILGIGDQGWGGVSIAIGKLALYTAGGVSPYRSLPVVLDVGTDRADLLKSSGYLGARQQRLRGAEYHAFMDKVVDALAARWPRVVLQWEDLSKDTAFDVLERYRKKIASFNDDIQGTGAVTLAGLVGACAIRGRGLRDESVIVYGAGAGGVGVAWTIQQGMIRDGLTAEQARAQLFVIDSKGLLVEGRAMEDYKKGFAQPRDRVAEWGDGPLDLQKTIEKGKATVLLGLSGQPGTFTEPMLRAMCVNTERPVVFPLSNPTSACEATPADLLAWTHGRAMVATGSPFEAVRVGDRDVPIGQGNNAFIFPGLGFGSILAEVSEVTDGMVLAAAYALADYVREKHLASGLIYPPVDEMRQVSARVATRVIEQAFDDGVARTKKTTREDAPKYVESHFWRPKYIPIEPA